jgi:hypothetical protein
MNKKKKLTIAILKSLESFVNLAGEKFKIIDPKENLLHVLDIDNTSDFHFKIEKYEKKQNGYFQFLVIKKPINENDNGIQKNWIDIKNLESQFKNWLDLLNQYETIESFFDDPIIKSNAGKFYQKFDIIDENADVETFDLEQQLFLEEYLDNSRKKLEKLKKGKTEDKIIEIEILENETEEIKSALTIESKKRIMIRLSKFWGRAQKTGLQVIKEIFVNVSTELMKKLLLE